MNLWHDHSARAARRRMERARRALDDEYQLELKFAYWFVVVGMLVWLALHAAH